MTRPQSIRELASQLHEKGYPLWKPLGEFLDEFYEAEQSQRQSMIDAEPTALIERKYAAFLAGAAEYLARAYGLKMPEWIEADRYFLDTAFVTGEGLTAETLFVAESPVAFRRRFVFTEAQPLRRKLGPRFQTQMSPQ